MYCTRNGGKFAPLARDYGSLDGLNTSCFMSDELHAQKDRKLYDVLDSSTGARSQPLGVGITTAGTDRAGVCYALRTYLTKILNTVLHAHGGMGYQVKGGTAVDETFFGVIYTLDSDYAPEACETPEQVASARARGLEVDEEKKLARRPKDEWGDEAMWPKANPMLFAKHAGAYASTLLEDLRSAAQKARTMPSEQAEFRTKRCNEWLNADTAWMDMHAWNACADPDLDELEFKGEACTHRPRRRVQDRHLREREGVRA
jgi:phage terminase large subunit-like protein